MAGSRSGGFTLEFQKQSYLNLNKQMEKLSKIAPEKAFKMLVQLLFDIKFLAQQKLKSDRHIDTSRLRNSIYVKTLGQKFAKKSNNSETYTVKGKSYSSDFNIALTDKEGAVGTNVEYADAIEFGYPPHIIEAKDGGVLSWLPKTEGKVQFTNANNKTTTRKYYKDRSGQFTLKRDRIFAKRVRHPGFAGDSFLYWALKNVDVDKRAREISKELLNTI